MDGRTDRSIRRSSRQRALTAAMMHSICYTHFSSLSFLFFLLWVREKMSRNFHQDMASNRMYLSRCWLSLGLYTVILSKDNRNKSSPAKNSTHTKQNLASHTHEFFFLFPWKKIINKNPIRPCFSIRLLSLERNLIGFKFHSHTRWVIFLVSNFERHTQQRVFDTT